MDIFLDIPKPLSLGGCGHNPGLYNEPENVMYTKEKRTKAVILFIECGFSHVAIKTAVERMTPVFSLISDSLTHLPHTHQYLIGQVRCF